MTKSTVINEITQQSVREGVDVLILSQAHQAVDGILKDKILKTEAETGIAIPKRRLREMSRTLFLSDAAVLSVVQRRDGA